MNKKSAAEEIESLKFQVKLLEAQFHTLYGTLAAKKIIDDKEFQTGSKEMEEYMGEDEEQCEIECNKTMTYTDIKSTFVTNELKKTSWKKREYIDDLMKIEMLVSGKTFGLPTGYIRKHLKRKYPQQWKAIFLELDPKGYEKALQRDQKEKEKEQQKEKKFKKEVYEEGERDKEAWKRAGGKI